MIIPEFDLERLTPQDRDLAWHLLRGIRAPDRHSENAQVPYQFWWNLIEKNTSVNVGLLIQTGDDPAGCLIDYPWDHTRIILSGGYRETLAKWPDTNIEEVLGRVSGDTVWHHARWAHKITLDTPVCMMLVTTGKVLRKPGHWIRQKWHEGKAP